MEPELLQQVWFPETDLTQDPRTSGKPTTANAFTTKRASNALDAVRSSRTLRRTRSRRCRYPSSKQLDHGVGNLLDLRIAQVGVAGQGQQLVAEGLGHGQTTAAVTEVAVADIEVVGGHVGKR